MKFDERHLACLAAVVDCGSASKAADLLGTSQPALSRIITMLESRLGEPLFVKGRRPLRPTPLGLALASYGRAIFDASQKASETVENYAAGGAGLVRLGGVPYIMDAFVSRMIGSFLSSAPEIRIEQSYGYMSDLLGRLEADQLDLVLGPIGTADLRKGLHFTPIIPVRNVIACSANHPLLLKKKVAGPDLVRFPWAAPLPGSPLMLDIQRLTSLIGISELPIRYSGGTLMAVINYIAQGEALAILPQLFVDAMGTRIHVSALAFDLPQTGLTMGIIGKSAKHALPASVRLTEHIATRFKRIASASEQRR